MKKKGMKLSKNLTKINISILTQFFFFGMEKATSQQNDPFNKGKTFTELVQIHQISNLKSGLLLTCERKDTLFVVFYLKETNNILCIPLATLNNNEYFVYEANPNKPFEELRKTNGILTSKMTTSFSLKEEQIYIVRQTLGGHKIVRKKENWVSFVKERIFYYSKNKGIFRVEYDEKNNAQDPYFCWPFIEGDFMF